MQIFKTLTDLFLQALIQLQGVTGNLGLSILLFTFLVRSILLPLSLPSMRSQKKMRELQPEVKKLKEKHKNDTKAFQMAQMELYKKYNANPLSGCLPQILQIAILIFLYQVLVGFLGTTSINGVPVNTSFLWMNLTKPDHLYILPVVAAVTQLIMSVMILPGGEVADIVPNDGKSKKIVESNKKEEETADMAATMQKQMLFMMPLMTGFIAIGFPSGLTLYMVATTIFSIGQQLVLSGPGGLTLYTKRLLSILSRKK
jgi:YidC/Oxa1 family membrane protein insertase